MALRDWAVKPTELKRLSRGDLLLFGVRCAMRVEHWIPKGTASRWTEGLRHVVDHALGETIGAGDARALQREISNAGAIACNRLAHRDEPLGRCLNYATSTLATAIDATRSSDRKQVLREIIGAAKLSASITAVWAHAGRIALRRDAVGIASTTTWAAIKADIPKLEGSSLALRTSKNPVKDLRALLPLWPGKEPSWSSPS